MQQFNKFDYLIFFTILLLVFGIYGGAYIPIRIFSFLFIPYVFFNLAYRKQKKEIKIVSYFFLFWFIYALVSIIWTTSKPQALKEIIYYPVHFTLFFLIVLSSLKAENPVKAIIYGWIMFFSLTAPIAIYEIITYNHLSMSMTQSDTTFNIDGIIHFKKFAAVTFGNYNSYVTILTYSLPFIYAGILHHSKIKHQVIFWVLVSICNYIILTNASRGGIFCMLISFFSFLYFYKDAPLKIKSILFISILLILVIIFYQNSVFQSFDHLQYKIIDGDSLIKDYSRFEIYSLALSLLVSSFFVGTGIGSIDSSMQIITNGIRMTHNLFLEILVQFGILIFTIFIILLFKAFIKAIKTNNLLVKYILITSILSMPFSSIINSGYLLTPYQWVFWGSLFVLYINNKNFKNDKLS